MGWVERVLRIFLTTYYWFVPLKQDDALSLATISMPLLPQNADAILKNSFPPILGGYWSFLTMWKPTLKEADAPVVVAEMVFWRIHVSFLQTSVYHVLGIFVKLGKKCHCEK